MRNGKEEQWWKKQSEETKCVPSMINFFVRTMMAIGAKH
jgi:hypothetical protein